MKTQRFLGAGLGVMLATAGAAHADLTWEHSGSVRLTKAKQPLLKFKMFNNMTASRNRVLMKFIVNPAGIGDALNNMGGLGNMGKAVGGAMGGAMGGPMGTPMGGMGGQMLSTFASPSKLSRVAFAQLAEDVPANPLQGSMTMVQRFDDGQFLMYSSMKKEYMGESIKEMMEKTRLDPWKKLAPKLSATEPPALTREQRARLGAEVRAATEPFTKMVLKTYFREETKTRMLNGLEGRGYRLTMLINTANPMQGGNRWMRIASEWWVAGPLAGDEVMVQMREAALKLVGRERKTSTSMWINESPRVMWEMLPEEIHKAVATLVPLPNADPDSPEFKRVATPLAMYMTVSPPDEFKAKWGEVRMEMNLARRGVEALAPAIFEAPVGYKHIPMPDFKKQMEGIENPANIGIETEVPLVLPKG